MYSIYIKTVLKDFQSMPMGEFQKKYKPEEMRKAKKLSDQEKHRQFIDNQVKK